jgi:chromosome segregation ATPase
VEQKNPDTMARNKQMDVDGDESGSSSHGRESKRTKSKEPSANHSDTIGHSKGSQSNAESERILDLGAYTNTANTVIRSMLATQKAMNDLAQQYATHVKKIEEIDEIQKRHDSLEEQCKEKDEKIRKQDTTIGTLWEKTHDQKKQLAEEKKSLEKERRELEEDKNKTEKDKATAAKRLKMQGAEQESKIQKAFEKRLAELEKQFKDGKKELDRAIQEREEENKNRLTNLEVENTALSEKVERLEKEKEEHRTALTKAKDDCDDMTRVKESHKAEARRLETRLKAMENEFAFNNRASDF